MKRIDYRNLVGGEAFRPSIIGDKRGPSFKTNTKNLISEGVFWEVWNTTVFYSDAYRTRLIIQESIKYESFEAQRRNIYIPVNNKEGLNKNE